MTSQIAQLFSIAAYLGRLSSTSTTCAHFHLQAVCQAGVSVAQPSTTGVAVGIASAEYNNHIVPRFTNSVSAYSATGGALSVASGRLRYAGGSVQI